MTSNSEIQEWDIHQLVFEVNLHIASVENEEDVQNIVRFNEEHILPVIPAVNSEETNVPYIIMQYNQEPENRMVSGDNSEDSGARENLQYNKELGNLVAPENNTEDSRDAIFEHNANVVKKVIHVDYECYRKATTWEKSLDNEAKQFLSDFDPEESVREKRKQQHVLHRTRRRSKLYTECGIFVPTGEDLCDCLVQDCPGCHFPCGECTSTKCGHQCRSRRNWAYETIENEGTDYIIKNPFKMK